MVAKKINPAKKIQRSCLLVKINLIALNTPPSSAVAFALFSDSLAAFSSGVIVRKRRLCSTNTGVSFNKKKEITPTTMATITGIRYTILQLSGFVSFKNSLENTPIKETLISAIPFAIKL